ncbi:acyltransferase [Marinobacter sp. CA1]|uniref:acyltransferase n=1 Tax=Marinobacter sp. CA1 TaxID=2817656 RepID=UPI001D087A98|nr:acyltransferase [Marinobacter sp. CA1]
MNSRQVIKRAVKSVFLGLALPLWLLCHLMGLAGNRDGVFQSFSQTVSLVPGKLGIYLRAAFYRLACPDTSDDISIGFLTVLSHRDTSIQSGVYIGPQCNIGKCFIGPNTLLGSGVHILSGSRQHDFSDPGKPIREQGGSFEKVSIGADCWLGNQAVVLTSVKDHSIVAAGSVVVAEFETGDILVGNPARRLRNRYQQAHDADGEQRGSSAEGTVREETSP